MGVFVAIFSVISINYQAFTQTTVDLKFIVVVNITLAVCIIAMLGTIVYLIHRFRK